MRFDLITLFPEMIQPVLNTGIFARAHSNDACNYFVHNLREWSNDMNGRVDDRPFGGGPGMLIKCQPIHDAVISIQKLSNSIPRKILLTPQGKKFNQEYAENLSKEKHLLILSGHYEGIDERVINELQFEEISIGDFILSGGELPSLVLTDAVTRLLPKALGDPKCAIFDSFSNRSSLHPNGLLEGPQYTRPRVWRNHEVPNVLLNGNHAKIASWQKSQSLTRTKERRPDLLSN